MILFNLPNLVLWSETYHNFDGFLDPVREWVNEFEKFKIEGDKWMTELFCCCCCWWFGGCIKLEWAWIAPSQLAIVIVRILIVILCTHSMNTQKRDKRLRAKRTTKTIHILQTTWSRLYSIANHFFSWRMTKQKKNKHTFGEIIKACGVIWRLINWFNRTWTTDSEDKEENACKLISKLIFYQAYRER